jgi:hypothetical protein
MKFYGYCLKICKNFDPNFGDKRTDCYITTTHRLKFPFPQGKFLRKQYACLEIKLKDRHFDLIEVIEAESQAVLNTLTEQDFQDVLKNVRSAGNCA